MRTPEVETAMQNAAKRSYALYPDEWKRSAELLAAEVERLEEQITSARASLRSSIPNDVAFARKRDYDAMEERAEAAEARVAELEALLKQTEDIAARRMESCAKMLARAEAAEARLKALEAQLLSYQVEGRKVGALITDTLNILSMGSGSCYTDKLPHWASIRIRMADLAELTAQNARLREALERLEYLARNNRTTRMELRDGLQAALASVLADRLREETK